MSGHLSMDGYIDSEQTLPSLTAPFAAGGSTRELTLTLVFHPDTPRIGEWAPLPPVGDRQPWVIGRRCPEFFSSDGAIGAPLDEPHISRRALEMQWCGDELRVRKFPAASRCRCNGGELADEIRFGFAQLERGVSLVLGHAVVLLLHLTQGERPPDIPAGSDGPMMGRSAYMGRLRKQIAQVAHTDLDVLIRGETGTGKELVASAIHGQSDRRSAPLISVNMAAIPSGLAAAALFGSARGAYTGSHKAGTGYFQQAEGGTLFLDEVGDTPLDIQPQILRALQQREIQVVGGPLRKVDLRIVSATDADLEDEGTGFRAALRHRLGAAGITLLSLREHPEDIGELAIHFIAQAAREFGRTGLLPHADSPGAELAAWAELFRRLVEYPWPGNIRELENTARQIVMASEQTLVFPQSLQQTEAETSARAVDKTRSQRSMGEVTDEEFDRVYARLRYEAAPTARELGVPRTSLYRHIEKSAVHRLAKEVPDEELAQVLREKKGDLRETALALKVSLSGLRARLRHSALDWR